MVVVGCCLDVIGDLAHSIAGFPEFEIDGLAVMMAVVLQGLHEVFGEVGVFCWIAVFLYLLELAQEELVVVFWGDDEALGIEPCGGPCEGA